MLLKESLGSVQVKSSLLFASLSDRISESENILQMMSKIQRAAKPRKAHRVSYLNDCLLFSFHFLFSKVVTVSVLKYRAISISPVQMSNYLRN